MFRNNPYQVLQNPIFRTVVRQASSPYVENIASAESAYMEAKSKFSDAWNFVEGNIDIVKDGINIIDSIAQGGQSSGIPVLDQLIRYIGAEPIYLEAKHLINQFDVSSNEYSSLAQNLDGFIGEALNVVREPTSEPVVQGAPPSVVQIPAILQPSKPVRQIQPVQIPEHTQPPKVEDIVKKPSYIRQDTIDYLRHARPMFPELDRTMGYNQNKLIQQGKKVISLFEYIAPLFK